MLEHAIEATTFPGDIVLDCFAGSGSTAVAALRLGRRAVAMEITPEWTAQIATRLEAIAGANTAEDNPEPSPRNVIQAVRPKPPKQYSLLDAESVTLPLVR